VRLLLILLKGIKSMDVYQIVTDKIICLLEQGTIPWRKPWAASNGIPRNLITNKEYRGMNIFLLGCQEYSSPYWVSYKQAISRNGSIRKGEKASLVVFYQFHLKGTEGDVIEADPKSEPDLQTVAVKKQGGLKSGFLLKYYSVFNLEQCEGIAAPPSDVPAYQFSPIEKAEQIVTAMIKPPEIHYGSNRASYSPVTDIIRMPAGDRFEKGEEFYSLLFHELGHSTGHISRLGRKEVMERNEFGSQDYSAEELCAEMSAAMLCAVAGISNNTIDMSASYIESWLSAFRSNKKMLVVAAAKAQKAADYILNRHIEEEL
jgi:antirestriction protein ArdC